MCYDTRMSRMRSRRPWVIAYMVTSALLWIGGFALIARRSPGLIRERIRPGPGALEGTAEEAALYALPAFAHWLLAAIDRPGSPPWRPMPAALQALGLIGYALANIVVVWAEVTNPFFSAAVRLQTERGQRVITNGPYAFVRHPGYAAGVALFVTSALALGSWLSLLPAIFFSLAIVRRTRIEDRFLKSNLPGYAEYAQRVRFCYLPGLW
jgi:protein-S-isoprenylcysteine O-methyltransferase Ste14